MTLSDAINQDEIDALFRDTSTEKKVIDMRGPDAIFEKIFAGLSRQEKNEFLNICSVSGVESTTLFCGLVRKIIRDKRIPFRAV